jgi:DNA-binding GntR family transcriptional regulator
MSLTALTRKTADRQVADILRDHIVRGELAAGSRLTEIALAEQFSISRGSIRAALQLLTQEGLIEQTPYIGWAVAALSAEDAWELCTLRASMEGMAARLASERASDAGRETLKEAYQGLVDAAGTRDERLIAEADFSLHKTIVALSGHRRLIQQYALVEAQVRMYIASSDSISGDAARVVLEHHGPIVDAIVQGNKDLAGRLSEEHNQSEGRKLMDHLEAQQEAEPPTT